MNAVTRHSIAHPWRTVVIWLILVAASVPFALALTDHLKAGGFTNPRGEGAQAQAQVENSFDDAPNSLQVAVHNPTGDVTAAADAVVDVAAGVLGVSAVRDYAADPALLSDNGRTALVHVDFAVDNTATQNLVPVLRAELAAAVGSEIEVNVTGAPALDYDLNVQSKADATRAEMIAFPLLFVVLLLVFRSVGAMLAPLVLAGLALVVTQALGFALAQLTDLSILFTNGVSLIGLAVAVDYSLFIVKRYREQLAAGEDYASALETAMTTAGRSVLFSALAVVVALSALFIPRIMVFTSIGLAGVLVTLVALALSMTLLPAALTLMGGRINWLTLRPRRGAGRGAADALATPPTPPHNRGHATGALVGLAAVMVLLALPMLGIRLEVPVASADILPQQADSRVGVERLRDNIGSDGLFPIQIVLNGPNSADVLAAVPAVTDAAGQMDDVTDVRAVTSLGLPEVVLSELGAGSSVDLPAEATAAVDGLWSTDGNSAVARVLVLTSADPDSPAAHDLVRSLRADLTSVLGEGVEAQVTGATAQGVDFDDLVVDSIPVILGGVALATFVLLLWAFRSWRLPVMALILNALVVSASLGILTATFQWLFDEPINSVTPVLVFAIMFGLSMDYLVIMISRMRELYQGGMDHVSAVRGGVKRTRGLVNGAALIMVAVFASFGTAEISIVRQLGMGLAVAVILDAVVVRLLLMPAALRVLGPKVWGRNIARIPQVLVEPTTEPLVMAGVR